MSNITKYKPSLGEGAIRQGEILTNLAQLEIDLSTIDQETPAFNQIIHPYVIVVSQDCDLDWDYKFRTVSQDKPNKELPYILFCMMTDARQLRERDKTLKDKEINSDEWNRIKNNKSERYHFFEKVPLEGDLQGQGLPELGVDFKRYFTIPSPEVYHKISLGQVKRRCCLVSPYLEHFSSRFVTFLSRIALPEDYESE